MYTLNKYLKTHTHKNRFIYAWGDGMYGKLGVSDDSKTQTLPNRVGMITKRFRKNKMYYQVAAGSMHSVSLSTNGQIFTWGSSKNGNLGIGFNKELQDFYT